jgi:hypothetical protein
MTPSLVTHGRAELTLNGQSGLSVKRRNWKAWPTGRIIAVQGDGIDWTLEKLGWRVLGIRNTDETVVMRQRYAERPTWPTISPSSNRHSQICCWMSGLMRCVQPLYGLSF